MAGKSFPRFERSLRLELNDMIHAAETTVLETVGQLIDEFIIGYDQSGNMGRNYIVRGFTVSNTSGTLLAINNGVALCQYRHRGAIKSAVHLSGGDPQKVIDVGGLSNGTYYVYVRFDLSENEFQNRLALDPLASPAPAERVRNVPTRRTESWSVTFADGSPGDEWTQVASFGMSGGAITGVTDTRNLYFEGAPSGGAYPLVPTTDWGTTGDRNNSRGTYGVQGLRKFVRAVQQQLETLQGDGKKWWQTPTKALTDKLNRDGTNTITGAILPDGNATRDLGASGTQFRDIYSDDVYAGSAFKFSSPATTYRSIPLTAWENVETLNVTITWETAGLLYGKSAATASTVWFPIPAPVGYTLTEVSLYWSVASGSVTLDVDVIRVDTAGANQSLLSGGAGAHTVAGLATEAPDQYNVILADRSYYLVIAQDTNTSCYIHTAQATFTVGTVAP